MHIRLAPGTTLTNVEGKDVLFSVKTGDSYGLNETAARMLRLGLEADLDEVVNRLAGEYGAERQEIRDDFEELVARTRSAEIHAAGFHPGRVGSHDREIFHAGGFYERLLIAYHPGVARQRRQPHADPEGSRMAMTVQDVPRRNRLIETLDPERQ